MLWIDDIVNDFWGDSQKAIQRAREKKQPQNGFIIPYYECVKIHQKVQSVLFT